VVELCACIHEIVLYLRASALSLTLGKLLAGHSKSLVARIICVANTEFVSIFIALRRFAYRVIFIDSRGLFLNHAAIQN